MRLPYGTLKKISEKTGKEVNFLSDLAACRKRPGRNMAAHLESTTGISAVTWMYGSSDEIKKAILRKAA